MFLFQGTVLSDTRQSCSVITLCPIIAQGRTSSPCLGSSFPPPQVSISTIVLGLGWSLLVLGIRWSLLILGWGCSLLVLGLYWALDVPGSGWSLISYRLKRRSSFPRVWVITTPPMIRVISTRAISRNTPSPISFSFIYQSDAWTISVCSKGSGCMKYNTIS